MFPATYFAPTYFAPTYWPEVGAIGAVVPTITSSNQFLPLMGIGSWLLAMLLT